MRTLGICLITLVAGSVLCFAVFTLAHPVLEAKRVSSGMRVLVLVGLLAASYLFAAWVGSKILRKRTAIAGAEAVPKRGSGKRAVGVFATVAVLAMAWVAYLEIAAEGSAKAFCEAAPRGTSSDAVAKAAMGKGEKRLRQIQPDSVTVGFIGLPPYSRHFCTVETKEGKVTNARYSHLD